MRIEVSDEGAWAYRRRSCGQLPDAPLHEVLQWVVEQLHYGHFAIDADGAGDGISLTLGRAAKLFRIDSAEEAARNRDLAVQLAGILARAREQGIEPKYADLSDRATVIANHVQTARMNTEFHYAFELVDVLKRIAGSTFLFTAPPVMGLAPAHVVDMLRESARCFLLGLARPAIAACRTCLEAVLEDVVKPDQLLQERWQTKRGELECLINVAARTELLTSDLAHAAHMVRKVGNDAVHGKSCTDEATWDVLVQTRRLAEHLYMRSA